MGLGLEVRVTDRELGLEIKGRFWVEVIARIRG